MNVLRAGRWVVVFAAALALAWPAAAPAQQIQSAPTVEQLRQFLQSVTIHIDIELPDRRGVCTGWIGWSESARSAVYTAAHCHQPNATYRMKVGGGDPVTSTGFAKWDVLDLMVLWIPRGQLPVLRSWKQIPTTPFRAMYMLTERSSGARLVEVDIPRVYSEIRFENRPAAVALPLYSYPGTSGAPVIDLADGLLVGMVVGFLDERPDIAAVVPAQTIYGALISGNR